MKHNIPLLVILFALSFTTLAQVSYDEEHEAESFSLDKPLDPNKCHHYTASNRIDFNPGFSYTPITRRSALFEIDEMMVCPPTYGNAVGTAYNPNDSIQAPGGLPYSLPMTTDVNDNGAAVITIPIDCPTGAGGLKPDLSFVYNSQAGDGIMGPGWSIGGMSKISRVPHKYYYSNYSNAVAFSDDDDYSLDGNRLIKGSDNNYYPEVFDNSEITFYNNTFTVKKPNGYVYTYGGTSDSRHYPQGITSKPVEWHLSTIQDPYGHIINFKYDHDNDGGFFPSQISYSGYTINFEYYPAERNDTQKKFFIDSNGQLGYSKITKELYRLNFSRGNESIHSYHLDYLPQGNLPNIELIAIQKFGTYNEGGSKPYPENCSASCQFVWHNSSGDLQVENVFSFLDTGIENSSNGYHQEKVFAARFPESDNDGRNDMVMLLKQGQNPFYKMVVLRNSSSNSATGPTYSYDFDLVDCGNVNSCLAINNNCCVFAPIDIDGDGYNEILYIYHDQYPHYHAKLIKYDEATHGFIIIDVPIDSILPASTNNPYEFHVGDFDGNGCSDLLVTNGKFIRIYLSVDGAFNTTISNVYGYNLYNNAIHHYEYIGDFTGDGRDQLISLYEYSTTPGNYRAKRLNIKKNPSSNTWILQVSQEYSPAFNQHFGGSAECTHFCQGDFNGDNKQDFVAIMQTTEDKKWYFYLSKGDGINFELKTWGNVTSYSEIADEFIPVSADFNGDGFSDLNITKRERKNYPPNQLNSQEYYFYYRYQYLIRVDDDGAKVLRKCLVDENDEEQYVGIAPYGSTSINQLNWVMSCVGNFRGTSSCEVAYTTLTLNNRQSVHIRMWNTGDFDNPPLKAIANVRNGLGAATEYEYVQHTYQGTYEMPTKTDRDPIIDYTKRFTQHLNVVKKMKVETDEGVSREILYFFRRPIMHTRGKGFLGFKNISNVVECQSNNSSPSLIGTDRVFKLNTEYYVLYPYTTTIHHNKTGFNEYEYTYQFLNSSNFSSSYSGMPRSVFMPVLEEEKNINTSTGMTTTKKVNEFDEYGNPKHTITTVETNGFDTKYRIISTYSYLNNTNGRRLIGLVSNCSETYNYKNNPVTINTAYTYDNCGFMTRRTCNGIAESFSRDGYGNTTLICRTANGHTRTETMTYTSDGRFLKSHRDALGHTTNYQYINRNGLLRSVTDPNGLVTTYHYDMLGNVTSIDYPDGTKELFVKRWTSTYAYSGYYTEHPDMPTTGNPVYYTWSKRTGQPATTSFFDQHDRLLRSVTTDFTGRKIYRDYTYYNKSGLLHTESLPYFSDEEQAAGATTYSYDYLDRVISISKPGCMQYEHKYNGNTELINEFDGSTKIVKYAPNGLPYQVTDNGTTIEYNYFGDGKIMSTKVGGNNNTKIEYTYDANRHPHTMSDPSLGLRTYLYNAFGELISETNNKGQETTYTYDALGRMTSRTDEEGTTIWVYDQQMVGLLDCSVYEPTDTGEPRIRETFEYDQLGRLIRQEQLLSDGDTPLTFTYGYNKFGHRGSITYPSGYAIMYKYDTNGNMITVKNSEDESVLWSAASTDKFGNITDFTLGNNINVSQTYDSLTGLVTNLSAMNNRIIQDLKYNWNDHGNLTERYDLVYNHNERFSYDKFNRLSNIEIDGNNSRNIIFDNLGNASFKYDAGSM